ncbi:MAG TPA: SAM-dependent methyltransferase [Acidimicrobiales bacterium]|jgi:hypothetical protein|nr:SAM-dependent methyltransferase [Acidimicrobiales bacterium]
MREGRASRTAEHNALFRALETLRRPGDRLVDDPLAAALLSRDLRAVALGARARPVHAAVLRIIDGRWRAVRTSVVARTRLIDDTFATIIDDAAQVVVLGAGFDTRPYRLPSMTSKAVFEVDHPDTQRRKRERLAGRRVPCDHVRFAATDFVHAGLGTTLAAAGVVKHLAWAEDRWFVGKLLGKPLPEPWRSAPMADEPDLPFESSRDDSVADVVAPYGDACQRSRVAAGRYDSLDAVAAVISFGQAPVTLRWLLVHMINETAWHLGHLDVFRDGLGAPPAPQ